MDNLMPELERTLAASEASKANILRLAGMKDNYLRRLFSGEVKLTRMTLQRIRLAAARAKRMDFAPTGQHAAAGYRLAVAIVARFLGMSPADILAADPAKRATADPAWLAVARQRRLALYVAHIYLGIPQAELARAAGMSKAAVSIAMNDVEDLRGEPETEALLGAIEEAFR